MGLGDSVGKALALAGITDERVSAWIGKPCGCPERREKMNRLGYWAARVLSGKTDLAEVWLARIMADD